MQSDSPRALLILLICILGACSSPSEAEETSSSELKGNFPVTILGLQGDLQASRRARVMVVVDEVSSTEVTEGGRTFEEFEPSQDGTIHVAGPEILGEKIAIWLAQGSNLTLIKVFEEAWNTQDNTTLRVPDSDLYHVAFRVTDSNDQPIKGARADLLASAKGMPAINMEHAISDASGILRLGPLVYGNWWVQVCHRGFAPLRFCPSLEPFDPRSEPDDHPRQKITMLEARAFTCSVVTEDGQAAGGARVVYWWDNVRIPTSSAFTTEAGPGGLVVLRVPKYGRFYIKVEDALFGQADGEFGDEGSAVLRLRRAE